jgi:tetrahydromethanopterin S-methyltransferase subunit D
MNLDPNNLLASMFLGTIGTGLIYYARSQRRVPHGVIGGVLLVYPYFVDGVLPMLAIGAALLVLLFLVTRLGI